MTVKDPEKPSAKIAAMGKPHEAQEPAAGKSEGGIQRHGGVTVPSEAKSGPDGKRVGGDLGSGKTPAQIEKGKPQDEEQQVKAAALELAKNIGGIEKIKICYVDRDDEWWATLYEDIGTVIDVKQFIWNRELEKFDPFLILKRISKSKLDSDLKQSEPGRNCAVMSAPEAMGGLSGNSPK